ncbi:hypothetical protein, partial [Rhizobium halophilum]|uniref:hypothetical protein n=1 Tax=Rhizobium halophilum TaxID=2846852 RepID=UPI001EFED388
AHPIRHELKPGKSSSRAVQSPGAPHGHGRPNRRRMNVQWQVSAPSNPVLPEPFIAGNTLHSFETGHPAEAVQRH